MKKKLTIFTTRPDTIFGATFIALSADHELSKEFKNDKNFINFKKNVINQELQRRLYLALKK